MAILESIALKSLTVLTTGIVKKFADKGWSVLSEEIKASFSEENIKEFCIACNEYVNLRTLYSSQQDIFIDDVYVPLYMSPINEPDNKIEITNLSYYNSGITNIIGSAGQGKSTFLRKMLINELKRGVYLTIFFELKNFKVDIGLLGQIVDWFKRHNIDSSEKGIGRLLKSGHIKLLLDGFDEMPPSIQDIALTQIKDLARAYPDTSITVTTRPDTVITIEPFISNYKILDLTLENVNQLYLNISGNEATAADAMAQIEKYPKIEAIVKTPILAILLFITYRAWSKIPDNLSDFYKKIFITLLTHHDSLKPGSKIDRGINIPLNDYQIENIFSIFCFKTFSEDKTTFSYGEAAKFVKEALESEGVEGVCPHEFVKTIKQCTGIICNNGYDDLTFSHKSLQEYYTALYIEDQKIHDVRNFYKSVKFADQEQRYKDVLTFLSGIDTENYTKYYYIPVFKEMFEMKSVKESIPIENQIIAIKKCIKQMGYLYSSDSFNTNDNDQKALGITFMLDAEFSSFLYLKFSHLFLIVSISTNLYEYYGEYFRDEIISRFDQEDECIIPVEDILEVLPTHLTESFENQIERLFLDRVIPEHTTLIKKLNAKKKPSLLKQVFKATS